MLFINSLPQLFMLSLSIFLHPTAMQCIKIGISAQYNISTTTTTETPTTNSNAEVSIILPETATTPSQTFPPRKNQKRATTTTVAPTTTDISIILPTATSKPDANSLNATAIPTTTTTKYEKDLRFYYCSCDMHADQCEINCCCDQDCPPETLLVFNCLQSAEAPQLQARLEDFQYTHGLPSCQINDGWLCVFRTNTKPPKMQPLSNTFHADQYNKWPAMLGSFEGQSGSTAFTSYYKFGQPLQLWQPDSKQVSNLELPIAYESTNCHLKQALQHLQPLESSCLMRDVAQLQNQLWTLLNVTSSQQILSKPHDLDEQDVRGINIKICLQSLQQPNINCMDQVDDIDPDLLVEHMELQLMHNFTHILEAQLLLKEASMQSDNDQIWLTFKLVYKPINDVLTKPSSGPLGYVLGEPVLLAKLQAHNDTEKEQPQQVLSYFQSNATGHYHYWLTPCEQSVVEERQAVSFGVDMSKQCKLRQLTPMLPEHDNHTDYCQHLQADIWRTLLPHNCTRLDDLSQVFISQLGRPQPDKWLPLELTYAEDQQRLPPIQGIYDETQQSLSCRNMLLTVSYEFYVAEKTLLEGLVPHQSVLLHARLVLGQRHDLEIVADEQVEIPLSASVMFFNTQDKKSNEANISIVAGNSLLIVMLISIILK